MKEWLGVAKVHPQNDDYRGARDARPAPMPDHASLSRLTWTGVATSLLSSGAPPLHGGPPSLCAFHTLPLRSPTIYALRSRALRSAPPLHLRLTAPAGAPRRRLAGRIRA